MLTAADFIGDWRIARVIDDRASGQNGVFTGRATLTARADGALDYQEEGVLRLGGGPEMTARRAYLWRFDPAGVAVFFDDGRAFHRFAPQGLAEGLDHQCAADLYRVTYDFRAWPRWRAVWTVAGPRKDYVMESHYQPRG